MKSSRTFNRFHADNEHRHDGNRAAEGKVGHDAALGIFEPVSLRGRGKHNQDPDGRERCRPVAAKLHSAGHLTTDHVDLG